VTGVAEVEVAKGNEAGDPANPNRAVAGMRQRRERPGQHRPAGAGRQSSAAA
jgi:hypothetical protein